MLEHVPSTVGEEEVESGRLGRELVRAPLQLLELEGRLLDGCPQDLVALRGRIELGAQCCRLTTGALDVLRGGGCCDDGGGEQEGGSERQVDDDPSRRPAPVPYASCPATDQPLSPHPCDAGVRRSAAASVDR